MKATGKTPPSNLEKYAPAGISEEKQLEIALAISSNSSLNNVEEGQGVTPRTDRRAGGEVSNAKPASKREARDVTQGYDEEAAIQKAKKESVLDEQASELERRQVKLLKCQTGLEALGGAYPNYGTMPRSDLEDGNRSDTEVASCWNDYRKVIVGAALTGCVAGALTVLGLVIEYTVFNT